MLKAFHAVKTDTTNVSGLDLFECLVTVGYWQHHLRKRNMADIDETLQQRGSRYGLFENQAEVSQDLKSTVNVHLRRRGKWLQPFQKEALELICHKMARIINGDENYDDSWADIAGYATLVAKRLQGKSL